MSVSALILAGGASTRMGSPKALLEWQGETFLGRLVRIFSSQADQVIVVLGHQAQEIREKAALHELAQVVINPHPEQGQLSSLQCGLRALDPAAEAFVFTPVDHAPIQEETVARLLAGYRASDALLVIPRCNGRRGHPVVASRRIATELLALPADSQARIVIRAHQTETAYVDVEDPAAVEDIDDPAAYARLLSGGGSR